MYSYGDMDERAQEAKLLQWVQRQGGVSRRKAQELIENGEVAVDGEVRSSPSRRSQPNG
jgi:16S rRNA U516 pseudouridylate synthase RsuA-like enzyme